MIDLITPGNIIVAAAATVAVCVLLLTRFVLARMGKTVVLEKMAGYQGIALKIFRQIEKAVPDEYGMADEDPAIAKSAHKMDLFLRGFQATYDRLTGDNVTEDMKSELRNWAAVWAEQHKGEAVENDTDA